MIDLHCHLLPGIDDGPRTMAESVAMARVAEAAGISTIVATPHVNHRFPNGAAAIKELAAAVSLSVAEAGLSLQVLPGAEIALAHVVELDGEELSSLELGASGWLLVEPPPVPEGISVDVLLLAVQRRGHRVLLAHPERCAAFQRDPRQLAALVDAGMLTSITAGSLVGRFGESVRRFALELADEGLVHNVVSDAHDDRMRAPSIASELAAAGLGQLAPWLTEDVPAAVLAGEAAPPPPPPHLPLRLEEGALESLPPRGML
jgi:protein-tyrosine phosphatase